MFMGKANLVFDNGDTAERSDINTLYLEERGRRERGEREINNERKGV